MPKQSESIWAVYAHTCSPGIITRFVRTPFYAVADLTAGESGWVVRITSTPDGDIIEPDTIDGYKVHRFHA